MTAIAIHPHKRQDGEETLSGREPEPDPDPGDADLVEIYLREIGKIPLLAPSEEARLARRACRGDAEAKERLTTANLRLVVDLARGYASAFRGLGLPLLDLIQEGNLGLLRAVEKYDPGRDVRFSTYATWWVNHAIRRALARHGRPMRLPTRLLSLAHRIQRAEEAYRQRGQHPGAGELARAVGVSVRRLWEVQSALRPVVSLERPASEEFTELLGDLVADEDCPSPEREAFEALRAEALERALTRLSPRQHEVLRRRYGLDGGGPHTLESVGQQMGISRQRARELERKALERLRSPEIRGDLERFRGL